MDIGNDMVDPRARMMGAEADVPFVATTRSTPSPRVQVMTLYPLVGETPVSAASTAARQRSPRRAATAGWRPT
jgi:hypothetical protein